MWLYVSSCSVRWPKSLAFAIRLNSYSQKVSQLMPREENDHREQLQVYYFQRGQIYSENGHWESLIALVCSDQMWKEDTWHDGWDQIITYCTLNGADVQLFTVCLFMYQNSYIWTIRVSTSLLWYHTWCPQLVEYNVVMIPCIMSIINYNIL